MLPSQRARDPGPDLTDKNAASNRRSFPPSFIESFGRHCRLASPLAGFTMHPENQAATEGKGTK